MMTVNRIVLAIHPASAGPYCPSRDLGSGNNDSLGRIARRDALVQSCVTAAAVWPQITRGGAP